MDNLNRNLRIGAVFLVLLLSIFIFMLVWLLSSSKQENKALYGLLKKNRIELAKCNRKSYNRFILAKDLTAICNEFRSSREAKKEYLF